jgi:hypothetical protein
MYSLSFDPTGDQTQDLPHSSHYMYMYITETVAKFTGKLNSLHL